MPFYTLKFKFMTGVFEYHDLLLEQYEDTLALPLLKVLVFTYLFEDVSFDEMVLSFAE